jgi:CheY-like chemotaxis protein
MDTEKWAAGAATHSAAERARRVVVVDDCRDSADSLTTLLYHLGYDVVTAYDGRTGLELAVRFRPDVVLLDIGLPGLDGFEVAKRLRQDWCMGDTLIIALTGYGQDEDRRRSQQAGFNAHLVKPVDWNELQQILADCTPKPPHRRG